MLNNLENIHTFVLNLLSVPALLIIFRIDNWYKTERTDHCGGLRAYCLKQMECLVCSTIIINLYFNISRSCEVGILLLLQGEVQLEP